MRNDLTAMKMNQEDSIVKVFLIYGKRENKERQRVGGRLNSACEVEEAVSDRAFAC